MDFALDAQREIYKRDLYLSPLEYGYDGTLVNSAGALYYSKRNRRKIVACYYFSGDVILYKINRFRTKKDDEKLSFILKTGICHIERGKFGKPLIEKGYFVNGT